MNRRSFTRIALGGAAAVLARPVRAQPPPAGLGARHDWVLLVTSSGDPIRVDQLVREEEYLFFYPFVSTPCLLLDLGRPVPGTDVPVRGHGTRDRWSGGVGPTRSIVGFTAICPHQWAHPERAFSAIAYHGTGQRAAVTGGRDRLIVCCAHGSASDPEAGGRVEQGPAEVPLAPVVLTWDRGEDRLSAHGLLGIDSFDRFFGSFKGKTRRTVEGQTVVMRLRDYSAAVARC